MLFNSASFIFLFLPACFFGFRLALLFGPRAGKAFLVVASLIFYSIWHLSNLPVLLFSLVANYLAVTRIIETRSKRLRNLAIVGNLLLLACFKYSGLSIVLPLGISFFTFQKIALLLDASAGRVKELDFLDFCVFVTFFPQLLSGPIVHHHEMMPQFKKSFALVPEQITRGLTLFILGLAKKVLLADGIAAAAAPSIFDHAQPLGMADAWIGTLAYSLQIYFDFSGYSDMAVGLGRLFGVELPLNFNSPFKATSIIDYWKRWHITLYRFLISYVYNPLMLWLARAAGDESVPFVIPTLVTMLLSGLWHGGAAHYLAWGLLQGLFLVVNNLWRAARWPKPPPPLGTLVTFAAVVLSNSLFRAPDLRIGWNVFSSMLGLHSGSFSFSPQLHCWLVIGLAIVWGIPNSQELRWRPTRRWAVAMAAIALVALYRLTQPSQFLYFDF